MQILSPESETDFTRYFDLRWRILREPWGQPRGSERDTLEGDSWHRMACLSGRIPVGVARLHLNSPAQAQIRYMAVERESRQRGIGTALVAALEQQAWALGVTEIVLHAREAALDFYLRLGYEELGAADTLYGCIRHRAMRKWRV
ncbi:MAG: GNAT family N-acetyltransferase [Gammaproteobacteria bacterium]